MSTTTPIWGNRRTKQLVTAALAGELLYADDGVLLHRATEPTGHHLEATRRDTAIIAALIDVGLLRRDPDTGAVTAAGGP